MNEDEFYSSDNGRPLQQGDIFATSGIIRITSSENDSSPTAWAAYDKTRSALAGPIHNSVGLDSIGGRALTMVLSHDCQLDKEINIAARALMKKDSKLSEAAAFEIAEDDDELDRYIIVSPIVDADRLLAARDQNSLSELIAGRVIGYFPLPDSPSRNLEGVIVDLSYRATVDRLTLTDRLTSLSDPARLQLRYALARMDSLRTPDIGEDLMAAVGQKVVDIKLPKRGNQTIMLILENGKSIEVLPKPGNTPQGGPARKKNPKKTART